MLNSPWEGEVWSGHLQIHSHGRIVVTVPAGMGNRRFVLYVAGHEVVVQSNSMPAPSGSATAALQDTDGAALLSYDRPSISVMTPSTGSTSGGDVITLRGFGFGWGSTSVLNGLRNTTSDSPLRRLQSSFNPYDGAGSPLPLPMPPVDASSDMARALQFPPEYLVKVEFAQGCVTSAVTPVTAS